MIATRSQRAAAKLAAEIEAFQAVGSIVPGQHYSREFAAWYRGESLATVDRLIARGSRGGLYPTLKFSHKRRAVTGEALLRANAAAIC